MSKKILSVAVIFSLLVLFAAVSVSAQTAVTTPAVQPAATAVSAPANTATLAAGYTYPAQIQYYQNYGRRAGSARDLFGFDGIPFNGSHRAAFLRWRASR